MSVDPTRNMAEFPAGQEQSLKKLVSSFRCPVCRRGFDDKQVRVAARHEQLWIVSVRCARCRNQQVFWVALKENQGETVLRDLSEDEMSTFAAMTPVTGDDILDIHEFLADFDGDFKQLFTR